METLVLLQIYSDLDRHQLRDDVSGELDLPDPGHDSLDDGHVQVHDVAQAILGVGGRRSRRHHLPPLAAVLASPVEKVTCTGFSSEPNSRPMKIFSSHHFVLADR